MKFLVTVKLARNPNHDPKNKKTGQCPVFMLSTCTDMTGEHHSGLVSYDGSVTLEQVHAVWSMQYHVTRIETVEE